MITIYACYLGNGYIADEELELFLEEFISSVIPEDDNLPVTNREIKVLGHLTFKIIAYMFLHRFNQQNS